MGRGTAGNPGLNRRYLKLKPGVPLRKADPPKGKAPPYQQGLDTLPFRGGNPLGDYAAKANLIRKVLDFIQFGGRLMSKNPLNRLG